MEPVGLLRDLVAIPSLSGQEGAAVAFLVSAAARMGFTAHRDAAGNFVAELGDGPTTHVPCLVKNTGKSGFGSPDSAMWSA